MKNLGIARASERPVLRLVSILAVLSWPLAASPAIAQDLTPTHPRRARAMFVTEDQPAVLLDDDRVWLPPHVPNPLAVCAGSRCAPVDRVEECAAPECPGQGKRVVLRGAVTSVSGFPTGLAAFEAELAAMRDDTELAAVAPYFNNHPERSGNGERAGWSAHGAFGGIVGSFDGGGGLYAGASGALGLRLAVDGDDLWDSDFLETLLGDRFTLSVRGGFALHTEPQSRGFVTTLGGAFEAENRADDSAFQVPALLGLAIPEMGAVFRDALPAAFYARWSLPVKLFFSSAAGLELRGSIAVMDARSGDGLETLLTIQLGGFVQ